MEYIVKADHGGRRETSSKTVWNGLRVCNLLTLQVSVMLCTAHALFGPVVGRVFEEGQGVRLRWGCVILLPYFSLVIELPLLPILLGC